MLGTAPHTHELLDICRRLKDQKIVFALGGSGLLRFYGCKTDINDWDITTDAPIESVVPALAGLEYQRIDASGIFASRYLLKISYKATSIDLIGSFALKSGNEQISIPTTITDYWNEVPIGCPKAWVQAYQLLGRDKKAQKLKEAIKL